MGVWMKLLIVEDDQRVSNFLRRGFEEEGFETDWADQGTTGFDKSMLPGLDCIILDIMLPEIDGLTVCRKLRAQGISTPIILLTVKSSSEEKVEGLSAGADDYLVKPFSFEELLARVHAQIRRTKQYSEPVLRFRDLELDSWTRKARRGTKEFELTPKEFSLLEFLIRNAGKVVTEEQLFEDIWNLNFDPQTNVINVYIHHLRKKIDTEGRRRLIHTVRGKGFLLGDKP